MSIILSFIVPVYNTEKFLKKCIKTLSYNNGESVEFIFINDGSTDTSLEILNKYKYKLNNCRIITQENRGLSASRNLGIKEAKGEYIIFLDSDDYFEDVDLIIKCKLMAEKNIDFGVLNHIVVDENENIINEEKNFINNKIFDRESVINDFFINEKMPGIMCNKILKRSLFLNNNIEFPIRMYFEDMPTLVKIILVSEKIMYFNEVFYNYVQHKDSITNKSILKRDEDYLKSIEMTVNIIKDYKVKRHIYCNWLVKRLNIIFKKTEYYNIKTKVKKLFIHDILYLSISKHITIKEKIKMYINLINCR